MWLSLQWNTQIFTTKALNEAHEKKSSFDSRALFKATSRVLITNINYLLQFHFFSTTRVTLSFIQNALCFTNKNAISQITACFSVFTPIFPDTN